MAKPIITTDHEALVFTAQLLAAVMARLLELGILRQEDLDQKWSDTLAKLDAQGITVPKKDPAFDGS
jgi:hypothetical protein